MPKTYWEKLEAAEHGKACRCKPCQSLDREIVPLTASEWDERFLHHLRSTAALEFAQETMVHRHGERPGGPASATDLTLRLFWLTQVKRMDWKKLGFGAIAAVLGAVSGAIPAAADGGISGPEAWGIGAVALGALGLYLKDSNSHKGGDPRQYPGLKNTFKS